MRERSSQIENDSHTPPIYSPAAPGTPVDPGCIWADIDADGDLDLLDFAEFQVVFDGQ